MTTRKTAPKSTFWNVSAAFPGQAGDAMATFLRPQARMMEAMMAQNIEALDFVRTRFETDRAMMAQLAETAEPSAVMGLWSDFWQRMLADYTTETGKLASSMSSIAEQALKSAGEEGKALTDAMAPGGAK